MTLANQLDQQQRHNCLHPFLERYESMGLLTGPSQENTLPLDSVSQRPH